MATHAQILTALVNAIKSIVPANGYITTVNPANVFTETNLIDQMVQTTPGAYPRIFAFSDGAMYDDLPSGRIHKKEKFTVLAIFAKDVTNLSDPSLVLQVTNFMEDFESMIHRQKQMGGSDYVKLDTCATDVGTQSPEAVCIFEIEILYKRQLP